MYGPWIAAFAFTVVALVLVLGVLGAAWALKVKAKKDSPLKRVNYECGEEQDGPAWIQFHPRYYVVALFFVLFDVEAAYLFPWALTVRELGSTGLAAMGAFAFVLLLGWAYAVRKGALKWQ